MSNLTIQPTRVLLADDEPAVLAGMRMWLADKPDLNVIEAVQRHDDVVKMTELLKPDVIILDIRMPGEQYDAPKTVEKLSKSNTRPKIVMYSGYWGREFIDHYLKLGATGFLSKVDGHDYMVEAIRAVRADEIYYGRRVFKWINRPTPFSQLTTREFEVLRRVAGGHSNAAIAQSLCIAEGTARVHMSAILGKLGVSQRGQLIVLALMNGIEPYEPPEIEWD